MLDIAHGKDVKLMKKTRLVASGLALAAGIAGTALVAPAAHAGGAYNIRSGPYDNAPIVGVIYNPTCKDVVGDPATILRTDTHEWKEVRNAQGVQGMAVNDDHWCKAEW